MQVLGINSTRAIIFEAFCWSQIKNKNKKQNTETPQPALFRFIVYFGTKQKTRYESREFNF